MKASWLWLLLFLLAVALAGLLFWHPRPGSETDYQAVGVAPKPKGGDFVLTSADGPVTLKQYRGQVVVLYFGYTLCPDICPTSLAALAAALNALSPEELQRVQPIFVSVDPERDTPARLKSYVAFFHPRIIGATGTPAQLAEAARRYGASYRKVESESAAGYLIDHSADLYLIDPKGRLARILPHGTPPEEIAVAIRRLLGAAPPVKG